MRGFRVIKLTPAFQIVDTDIISIQKYIYFNSIFNYKI